MCLQYLDDRVKSIAKANPGIGYKIFRKERGNSLLFLNHQHLFSSSHVPINRWLFSFKIKRISTNKHKEIHLYSPCFHIYLQRPTELMPGDVVVKVKYRWPVAYGYDYNGLNTEQVVVARCLYVT